MDLTDNTILGKRTSYSRVYNPALLTPISRLHNRKKLGFENQLPFFGVDIWNAWELSWLNLKGKPQVAIGTIEIPCDSENIIESKSLKLYLNSLNQTKFFSAQELSEIICKDLSATAGSQVKFSMTAPENWRNDTSLWTEAICLDQLDINCSDYQPDATKLACLASDSVITEKLSSHLLKTNCPVTGQPDWATLFIQYTGQAINHHGLLSYIVSMRHHKDFHEHCTETIFKDITDRCQPQELAVYARYTRRGGLDINPFRSNFEVLAGNSKLPRQ